MRQLAARGERVVVVDNLVNGKRENLADVLSRDVTLLETDIRDLDAVTPHLREARAVYHLACLGVRHSVHSPHENHDVNATATLQLLAAAATAGVPRFVYVSSSEVYGGVSRRHDSRRAITRIIRRSRAPSTAARSWRASATRAPTSAPTAIRRSSSGRSTPTARGRTTRATAAK